MNGGVPGLKERIGAVRDAIARAAKRSGRGATAVRLIGVVKTVPVERVQEAVALGLEDLGENRVQEAEPKIAAVGRKAVRWHMVGHVQRNKAGRVVELFDCVHGVDGLPLGQALARRAQAANRTLPVLVEVNVSGEASKFGIGPSALEPLLSDLASFPSLEVRGLMTVGREVERGEDARADFARLRELKERATARLGLALTELSMGMSGDFEVAIEEGATMVRIGTALFGRRE